VRLNASEGEVLAEETVGMQLRQVFGGLGSPDPRQQIEPLSSADLRV
jgi:hypothetical protein